MKKEPVAFISDPHFHSWKAHATTCAGVNTRLLDTINAFKTAASMARTNHCKALFIAGDLFHVRGSLRPSVFNLAFSTIAEVAQDLEVFIVPGNHDMESYKSGETAVDTLEALPNVLVVKDNWLRVAGWWVYGLGYHHDSEAFKERVSAMVPDSDIDIVLMHQYIDDFTPSTMPKTGITVDWLTSLKKEAWFACGHFHQPGRAKGSRRAFNIGSLTQQTFGDHGERGLWILKDAGAGHSDIEFKAIRSPQFLTVETLAQLKKIRSKDNFIRARVKSIKTGEKIREAALEAGARSVAIELQKTFTSHHEKPITLARPLEMLAEYIDRYPKEYGHQKDQLLKHYEEICQASATA